MKVIQIKNKEIIEKYLRKNTALNLYQIGDLDDFFYKFTDWHAMVDNKDEVKQIVLIYSGTDLPVMLSLCDRDEAEMKELLKDLKGSLPEKFYSHLSKGLAEVLRDDYKTIFHGKYLKMSLSKENFFPQDENKNIRRLSVDDLDKIEKIYYRYPGNWFDKRMLETGKYFGYFIDGNLAGISGIHVYSEKYRIAVLGNITTHPLYRGKSICTKVTSELCRDLFKTVDDIGLNVHNENIAAIKSYKKIGFEIVAEYEEYMFIK